ncbi:LysR family transcriptional regulator [Bradyrhizobium erythrophlei]|uniref:LysR family transcriptional regulator n=1 Tax=Bradyrhizobium erythrophlei TaxID=1437360 RepID=UPI0035EB3DCD
MDRLDELRLFLAIVDSGNFAAGGRRFARSPSSTTRIVGELERRLGTRLLHRTTRKLSLTDAGTRLAEQARRLLADYDDAIDDAIGEAASLRGCRRRRCSAAGISRRWRRSSSNSTPISRCISPWRIGSST